MECEGWILLGQYPVGDPDGVGSWILHKDGEAALLELPPDLQLIEDAVRAADQHALRVKYVFVSHHHWDHFDPSVRNALLKQPAFSAAVWLKPQTYRQSTRRLDLAGEPLFLVNAPKHSPSDCVTIFRGRAMTGDIELGQVASVNHEVPKATKRESLEYLADFEQANGYRIHSLVSAHLNDFRPVSDWRAVVLG